MTVALVQSTTADVGFGPSLTFTFAATAAGNLLIAGFIYQNTGQTITLSSGWSWVGSSPYTDSTNGIMYGLAYYPNNPGGLTSLVFGTSPASSQKWAGVYGEFSGVATVSPLDASGQHGQTSAATSFSVTSDAPAHSDALAVGFLSSNYGFVTGTNPGITQGTGSQILTRAVGGVCQCSLCYDIAAFSTAHTLTWASNNSLPAGLTIATFVGAPTALTRPVSTSPTAQTTEASVRSVGEAPTSAATPQTTAAEMAGERRASNSAPTVATTVNTSLSSGSRFPSTQPAASAAARRVGGYHLAPTSATTVATTVIRSQAHVYTASAGAGAQIATSVTRTVAKEYRGTGVTTLVPSTHVATHHAYARAVGSGVTPSTAADRRAIHAGGLVFNTHVEAVIGIEPHVVIGAAPVVQYG